MYDRCKLRLAPDSEMNQGEILQDLLLMRNMGFTAAAPSNIESVQEGVCRALSCLWADDKLARSKTISSRRVGGLNFNAASYLQEEVSNLRAQHGIDSTEAMIRYMKENGDFLPHIGRVEETAPEGTPYNTPTIVAKVLNSKKLPLVMSYKWATGGHAIVMYRSSGKIFGFGTHVYFFDCNFGECKMEPDQFATFMADYKTESEAAWGGALQTFKIMALHGK